MNACMYATRLILYACETHIGSAQLTANEEVDLFALCLLLHLRRVGLLLRAVLRFLLVRFFAFLHFGFAVRCCVLFRWRWFCLASLCCLFFFQHVCKHLLLLSPRLF